MGDPSDGYDPPITKEEIEANLIEHVTVTTSTVLPDLLTQVIPQAPPKKLKSPKDTCHYCHDAETCQYHSSS